MATQTTTKSNTKNGRQPQETRYITREEGQRILDKRARERFGLSGEEFVRRYRAGDLNEFEHGDVEMIKMLIPLAE
jgi:ribosome-binding protein aMBF1 (putative translation factor)